jgi:hypothetical protein
VTSLDASASPSVHDFGEARDQPKSDVVARELPCSPSRMRGRLRDRFRSSIGPPRAIAFSDVSSTTIAKARRSLSHGGTNPSAGESDEWSPVLHGAPRRRIPERGILCVAADGRRLDAC